MECRRPCIGLIIRIAIALSVFYSGSVCARDVPTDPKDVLTAPGPDTAKVIQFLEQILRETSIADRNKFSQALLLKGRRSDISKRWTPMTADQTLATMPEPCWGEFTLVQRNGKRRFDLNSCRPGPDGKALKYCRLLNDEGSYKLDSEYLDINVSKTGSDVWTALAGEYFEIERAGDCEDFLTLAQTCERTLTRLKNISANTDYWRLHTVRCSTQGDLLILDIDKRYPDPENDTRYHNRFWIDSKNGYQLTKTIMEQRSRGGGLDSRVECDLEVQEISPGLFIHTKAVQFSKIGGSQLIKENNAGWRKLDLIVDEFKTHDFSYDDSLFTKNSLSLPVGTRVFDRRYDPPRQFVHGVKPIDEEVLQSAVPDLGPHRPASGYRGKTYIYIAVNSALLVVVVVWIIKTRRRSARNQEHK
jgi:hypothetical protein